MMKLKYTLVVLAFCLIGASYAAPSDYDLFDELDDELDEVLEMEPRFLNGNFNGLNKLSDRLRKKIRAVKEWHPVEMDDWNCATLSKVNAVQTGVIELRTPELNRIDQVQVDISNFGRKYKYLVRKIEFWEKMPFLWPSAAILRKHIASAASIKKEVIKLYESQLSKYIKAIEERIDSIRNNQMGPQYSDIFLRGTKINFYSKAEERILLKSIEAVPKCLQNMNVSDIYGKYLGRATKTLKIAQTYKGNGDSDSGLHKRIIYDAILSTQLFDTEFHSRRLFNLFNIQNINNNDNDNDNDINDSDFDDDFNTLPVSSTLTTYVQAIDKAARLIADKRRSGMCKIEKIEANNGEVLEDRLPSIESSSFISEDFYNSVQNQNKEIQNSCDLVKNIVKCDKAIKDFRDFLRTKINDEIVPGYTTVIDTLMRNNLGAQIVIHNGVSSVLDKCKTNRLKSKYVLKSSAQLNKAIEIYENGIKCLQGFGLNVNKSSNIGSVSPVTAFNTNQISKNEKDCTAEDNTIFGNADNILSRDRRMQEIQQNLVFASNSSLFNLLN